MLPEKLHNEGLAVDLPVHHLLSRQNVLLRLPDSGIIAFLPLPFTLALLLGPLRIPLLVTAAAFFQNGGIVRLGLAIPSQQIGKSYARQGSQCG